MELEKADNSYSVVFNTAHPTQFEVPVELKGFHYFQSTGLSVGEFHSIMLRGESKVLLDELVENPNRIAVGQLLFNHQNSNSINVLGTKLRREIPVAQNTARELVQGYDGGIRIAHKPLQDVAPGRRFHPAFTFYKNGFIDRNGKFESIPPQMRAILLKLFTNKHLITPANSFGHDEEISPGTAKTQISNLIKFLIDGREGLEKPIKNIRGAGYRLSNFDSEPKPPADQESKVPSFHLVPKLEDKPREKPKKRAVRENADAVLTLEDHPHHWLIDEPEGAISEAICKRCGIIKNMANSPDDTITNTDARIYHI